MVTSADTLLHAQHAPCGRTVDAETHRDLDQDGLVIDDLFYACGCRMIRHEFHDGSVIHRVIHHNGTVLLDELVAEHA